MREIIVFFLNFFNQCCEKLSYGLKISRNIEIKNVFHFRAYFHETSICCLSPLSMTTRCEDRHKHMGYTNI